MSEQVSIRLDTNLTCITVGRWTILRRPGTSPVSHFVLPKAFNNFSNVIFNASILLWLQLKPLINILDLVRNDEAGFQWGKVKVISEIWVKHPSKVSDKIWTLTFSGGLAVLCCLSVSNLYIYWCFPDPRSELIRIIGPKDQLVGKQISGSAIQHSLQL